MEGAYEVAQLEISNHLRRESAMLAWSFLEAKAKSRTIISSHYLIKSEILFSPLFPHKENKSLCMAGLIISGIDIIVYFVISIFLMLAIVAQANYHPNYLFLI